MGFESLISAIDEDTHLGAEAAGRRINEHLEQGRALEVFVALKNATVDTDFKVGNTETEDPSQMSADRVRDYIAGLEVEEQAFIEQLSATNACDPEEGESIYEGWHTQLQVRIASQLGSQTLLEATSQLFGGFSK